MVAFARTIRKPFGLFHRAELGPVLGRKLTTHRFEVVAGVKPFRNCANVLAQRLAITQECRAGEHVDLGAGIVDVIFACHIVSGEGQQICERIAEHRAASMPDMHRPSWVGQTYSTLTFSPLPMALRP